MVGLLLCQTTTTMLCITSHRDMTLNLLQDLPAFFHFLFPVYFIDAPLELVCFLGPSYPLHKLKEIVFFCFFFHQITGEIVYLTPLTTA